MRCALLIITTIIVGCPTSPDQTPADGGTIPQPDAGETHTLAGPADFQCALAPALADGECQSPAVLWTGFPLGSFSQLPGTITKLSATAMTPHTGVDYWAYVEAQHTQRFPLLEFGAACSGATDQPACLQRLDNATLDAVGFNPGCAPVQCRHYLVATRGEDVLLMTTAEEAPAFFAPLERAQEAALVASFHGYSWLDHDELSGLARPIDVGFELVVQKLTAQCQPVATHRFLLRVTTTGAITPVCSQLHSIECLSCL